MIWLTWRQQRFEVLIGAAVLGLIAAALIATGLQMAADYQQTGVAACVGPHPSTNCFTIVDAFRNRFGGWEGTVGRLNFLPLVFGLLFGAPFVLEMEQGTYRLAWTQSITRTQWVAIKLAVILGLTLLAAGIFTLLMTWWRLPFDHLDGVFNSQDGFDFEGTAPLSYAVFAVTLGIAVGTLIRKTVPAVGIAVAGFLALRLSILNFLRPHYLPPAHMVSSFAGPARLSGPGRGAWILSSGWSDRLGHPISDVTVIQLCNPASFPSKIAVFSCFAAHHIYSDTVYQPASRFWLFQGIETGIFLGLSALLLAVTVWWIRYRIT
ncbi:MAG TPA: hypothetical protein VFB58_14000 [Chloroflexota bacterium]|nr:hypothetical protein [Chloroflexota bacterium]